MHQTHTAEVFASFDSGITVLSLIHDTHNQSPFSSISYRVKGPNRYPVALLHHLGLLCFRPAKLLTRQVFGIKHNSWICGLYNFFTRLLRIHVFLFYNVVLCLLLKKKAYANRFLSFHANSYVGIMHTMACLHHFYYNSWQPNYVGIYLRNMDAAATQILTIQSIFHYFQAERVFSQQIL